MTKRAGFVLLLCLSVFVGAGIACRKRPATTTQETAGTPAPAGPGAAAGPVTVATSDQKKVKAVLDDLTGRFESLQAFAADTELSLAEAVQLPGTTKGKGNYSMMRRGGDMLVRFATSNFIKIDKSDEEKGKVVKTQEILWQVYDGKDLFLLVNQHQYRKVTKTKYNPDRVFQIGGRDLIESISAGSKLRLLPDEQVDGRPAYVLESAPAEGDGLTGKHWFDKETGVRLQVVEAKADGSEFLRIRLLNLNLKPEFTEDQFAFTLPERYELIDETVPPAAPTSQEPQDTKTP